MGLKTWITPWKEFYEWWKPRHFTIDCAADRKNAKVRPHRRDCPNWREPLNDAGTYCRECKRFIGRYYTEQDDGLAQIYGKGDVVFCNPPYFSSGPARVELWVRTAFVSSQRGARWFLVLPPSTDAKWFHEYVWDNEKGRIRYPETTRLKFTEGRIHFIDPTPANRNGARAGNILLEFLPWHPRQIKSSLSTLQDRTEIRSALRRLTKTYSKPAKRPSS